MNEIKLLKALKAIAAIEDQEFGPDWEEIGQARDIANAAIKEWEEDNNYAVPVIQPFDWSKVTYPSNVTILRNCSLCNLDLNKATCYSCNNVNCPTQPRVTS